MGYHKENREKTSRRRQEEELKKKFEPKYEEPPVTPETAGEIIRVDKNTVIYKKKKP